jgi:glucosylceramidase
MARFIHLAALICLTAATVAAQSVSVYETTPDLHKALTPGAKLKFAEHSKALESLPVINIDDARPFQQMDGFGASLTDSAAWLFDKKLGAAQTDAAFKMLFDRKDGIALNILRQPVGSSDLAVTFYSFDDLCQQGAKACTTPPGLTDTKLEHFSVAHDQEYILPLLKKALAVNPEIHVMLTPWSAPGWMKTTGSMLGAKAETKEASALVPDFYPAFATYLVKTIQAYQAAGVPVWALSVQNEPLFAPPTYSGMQMLPAEQAKFFGQALAPALSEAHLSPIVMAYDHNWDHPEYPETVLKDPRAVLLAAGTAWHHYGGDPSVMTTFHERFPQKDQWVTESSGGTWQKGLDGKGNILAEEAAELIAVARNWSKSYVLWALATDQNHGPVVGGCDTCRGLITIDSSDPAKVTFKPELDFYVLGHASKFLYPGAIRIASDEPANGAVKDVAFRNRNGTIVLYALNEGTADQEVRIRFHGKTVVGNLGAGSVTTLEWKP